MLTTKPLQQSNRPLILVTVTLFAALIIYVSLLTREQVMVELKQKAETDHSQYQVSLPQRVENFEKMLIQNELERHTGSIKETLNTLGVPRKTLYDKMRKYALDKADYK